ncbi:protein YgfX [Microbulbifer sp. NBRC 101763]|uniref:protein YgfX n=1 Tax=Microbulbifer sp. NBRC 101763 TaxID=1113820 RepID=UPI003340EAB0
MTTPVCASKGSPLYFERSARLSCVVAPSSILFFLLSMAVLQAAILLWLCGLPSWLFWILLTVILVFAYWEVRSLAQMVGILSTRERRWFWRVVGDNERQFYFRGELVLWGWLVVINGRDLQGRSLRLVLARDAISPNDWRRLQAALRFSR